MENKYTNKNDRYFNKLPVDLMKFEIFNNLGIKDLIGLKSTSLNFQHMINDFLNEIKTCTDSHYFKNNCFREETMKRIKRRIPNFNLNLNLDDEKKCNKYCSAYLSRPYGNYTYFHQKLPRIQDMYDIPQKITIIFKSYHNQNGNRGHQKGQNHEHGPDGEEEESIIFGELINLDAIDFGNINIIVNDKVVNANVLYQKGRNSIYIK